MGHALRCFARRTGLLELRESLRGLQTVLWGRSTDEAIAPEGEAVLGNVSHLLLRQYAGRDGRAVGRAAASVRDGEAADAVKLLEYSWVLRALHGRMARVHVVKAVVGDQVRRVADRRDVGILGRAPPVRLELRHVAPVLTGKQGGLHAEGRVARVAPWALRKLMLVEVWGVVG